MRIIDDRQTVMFSYGEWICNRVWSNVEREDSTAYGGIERDGRDAPSSIIFYFASRSTVFTGRSQWANRISKRCCSSRS